MRYDICWCVTHSTGIHITADIKIPLSVCSACIFYSEVMSFERNWKQWQEWKHFLVWFYLLINYCVWPTKLVWCRVTGTPTGNHVGTITRNCKHLETLLFLCTYHAFLLFIIYLFKQINNLETLFNAACLNLSIFIFNLRNCSISEMGSVVLPFELEKFLLFEPCVRAGVESSCMGGVYQGSNFSTWRWK